MGTRVPVKTGVPPMSSGLTVTSLFIVSIVDTSLAKHLYTGTMKLALCFALAAASAVTFAQKQFIGTYDVVMILKGKVIDNATLPPGQVKILELRANGTWLMHDMMSGWDGTWSIKNDLSLKTLNGPAGKLKKPDTFGLAPSPDRSRLLIKNAKDKKNTLEFRWNPKARANWEKRMKGALGK